MAGVFNKISDALAGKKTAAATLNKTGNADFSSLRRGRDAIMSGSAPVSGSTTVGDGHTTSGVDSALQKHADKIHPVRTDLGEIEG